MTKLQEALARHAKLAMEYNVMAWKNYARVDLTGIVRKDRGPVSFRRLPNPYNDWIQLDKEEDLTTIPWPGKEQEHEDVSLEQHRLHVKLHEAWLEVERLTKEVA